MKLYIKSATTLPTELQQAMQEYNDRKKRLDTRVSEYNAQFEPWITALDAWEEERKTNPEAPMPDRKQFEKYETIHRDPRFDSEYSIEEAEHTLTMTTLAYVAGTDNWVKVNRDMWVKVISMTENPRKYTYYNCQVFVDFALGTESFKLKKYRDDDLHVVIPLEILSEGEFCDYIANKFFEHPDDGYIADMIRENSTKYYPSFK